jgi:hypothetical protein
VTPELRTEILQEFSVLRSEIEKRVDMRTQLLTFTLIMAGTFLSVGLRSGVAAPVLFIYPVLATSLSHRHRVIQPVTK